VLQSSRLVPRKGNDGEGFQAELVKSPEHVHPYRITPLSIWNACAAGVPVESIRQQMRGLSKYDVPRHVEIEIAEYAERYGKLKLTRNHRGLVLSISAGVLAEELARHQTVASFLGQRIGSQEFLVEPAERGRFKQALIKVGYPVEDLAGYREGEPLEIILRGQTRRGLSFRCWLRLPRTSSILNQLLLARFCFREICTVENCSRGVGA
jgi:DNA excision repair protein ERCC-3